MPSLLMPRRRTSQPQYACGIDWGNPVTRKLAACGIGTQLRDIVTGQNPTSTGLTQKGVIQQGTALVGTSTAGGANRNVYPAIASPSGGATIVSVGILGPTLAYTGQLSVMDPSLSNTQNSGFGFKATSGGALRALGATGLTTNVAATGATAVANTPYVQIAIWDGATLYLYVNGVLAGSVAMATMSLTGNECIIVGDYGSQAGLSGAIAGWQYYTRAMSAIEAASIGTNPWQILSPGIT
jgi:hypothetical protein